MSGKGFWTVPIHVHLARAPRWVTGAFVLFLLAALGYFSYAMAVATMKPWRGWLMFVTTAIPMASMVVLWQYWERRARASLDPAARAAEIARLARLRDDAAHFADKPPLALAHGCTICGDSPIALLADDASGAVVGVCGACGMGWPPNTSGLLEEMLAPADWARRISGRLIPATPEAVATLFRSDQVRPLAPHEWYWDLAELNAWLDALRAPAGNAPRRTGP